MQRGRGGDGFIMEKDWNSLDGIEAAERMLAAAISSAANQIHLTSDAEGATIFFISPERIEFFTYIPACCRDRLYNYLRHVAGIDSYASLPCTGYGLFAQGEETRTLEIQVLKGIVEIDLLVKITM